MALKFIIDNREIRINSFNKEFGKGWGSIFKVTGNNVLKEIGLANEFYFKCDNAYCGTFKLDLEQKDRYQLLLPPQNWQQSALFNLLRNSVMSGSAYF